MKEVLSLPDSCSMPPHLSKAVVNALDVVIILQENLEPVGFDTKTLSILFDDSLHCALWDLELSCCMPDCGPLVKRNLLDLFHHSNSVVDCLRLFVDLIAFLLAANIRREHFPGLATALATGAPRTTPAHPVSRQF